MSSSIQKSSVNNPYPSTHKRHRLWEFLYQHELSAGVEPLKTTHLKGPLWVRTAEGFKYTQVWNEIYLVVLWLRDDFLKKYHFKFNSVFLQAVIDKLEKMKDWEGEPNVSSWLGLELGYGHHGNLILNLEYRQFVGEGEEAREVDHFTIEGQVDEGPRPPMPKRMIIEPVSLKMVEHYRAYASECVEKFIETKHSISHTTYPYRPSEFSGTASQPKHHLRMLEEYLDALRRDLPRTISTEHGKAVFNEVILHAIRLQLTNIYSRSGIGDPDAELWFNFTPKVQMLKEDGVTRNTLEKSVITLTLSQKGEHGTRGIVSHTVGNLYILP